MTISLANLILQLWIPIALDSSDGSLAIRKKTKNMTKSAKQPRFFLKYIEYNIKSYYMFIYYVVKLYMNTDFIELKNQIERRKSVLNELMKNYDTRTDEVLAISNELDQLIVALMRGTMKRI